MAVLLGEERYLLQPHHGSSYGIFCALDSRHRCPAPPGLMNSVKSVKTGEWSKNACVPLY